MLDGKMVIRREDDPVGWLNTVYFARVDMEPKGHVNTRAEQEVQEAARKLCGDLE